MAVGRPSHRTRTGTRGETGDKPSAAHQGALIDKPDIGSATVKLLRFHVIGNLIVIRNVIQNSLVFLYYLFVRHGSSWTHSNAI
jgi:hypothetical protein